MRIGKRPANIAKTAMLAMAPLLAGNSGCTLPWTVHMNVTPTVEISHALAFVTTDDLPETTALVPMPDLPANMLSALSFTVALPIETGAFSVGLMGVYDDAGTPGIAGLVSSGLGPVSFENVFGGAIPPVTEPELIFALSGNASGGESTILDAIGIDLDPFHRFIRFNANDTSMTAEGTVLLFSDGRFGGTASVTAAAQIPDVPEPSGAWLAAIGCALIAGGRRFNRAAEPRADREQPPA